MTISKSKKSIMRCYICGKESNVSKSKNGYDICKCCYRKYYQPKRLCNFCGNLETIVSKVDGKDICGKCYKKYNKTILSTKTNTKRENKVCSICGKDKFVSTTKAGNDICKYCYRKYLRPKRICFICGKKENIATKIDGQDICCKCYNNNGAIKRSCSICGNVSIIKKSSDGQDYCNSCYHKLARGKKKCSICGTAGYISKVDNDKLICKACYDKNYAPKRPCSICGLVKNVHKVIDGKDFCKNCSGKYLRFPKKCTLCSIETSAYKIIKGKPLCLSCLKNYFQFRKCSLCGKESIIHKVQDSLDICAKCYQLLLRPKNRCSNCGNIDFIVYANEEQTLCEKCYNIFARPKRVCFMCGSVKHTGKFVNNNPICTSCYQKYFQPKKMCIVCGNEYKVAINTINGSICSKCYMKIEGTCNRCGSKTKDLFKSLNLCSNCWHLDKLNKFLGKVKSMFKNIQIYDMLIDYSKELLIYRTPTTAYLALSRQIEVFLYFDNNNLELNCLFEKDLVELYRNLNFYGLLSLRNYLVKRGYLEPYTDEEIFIKSRDNYLNKIDKAFQEFFIRYTNSLIVKNVKLREKGWNNRFTYQTCNQYMFGAYLLLEKLRSKIFSIHELNNSILDMIFSDSLWLIYHTKDFLKWLNKNVRLFEKITISKSVISTINPYSDDEIAVIIQSLSKPTVSYREKAIGLLLILYGIRPSRLCEIQLNDYKSFNSSLIIRNSKITLNKVVLEILDKYISIERKNDLSLGSDIQWLFPGAKYNCHIDKLTINSLLKKHNISVSRSFSTAIINSLNTAGITPSIVIRGLGLNAKTIMHYYKTLNLVNTYELMSGQSILNTNDSPIENKYYVYIVKCSDESYYTGYTSNLKQRIEQHNKGNGSEYTRNRRPVNLVYTEVFSDRPSALKREKQIKKLDTYKKEKLIQNKNRVE